MNSSVRGEGEHMSSVSETNPTRRDVLAFAALGLAAGVPRSGFAAAPDGQLTWALHVSLAPLWFDPADTQALITPFMALYALHDAMVKPMPATSMHHVSPSRGQCRKMASAGTSCCVMASNSTMASRSLPRT
jgi:hypothetical protein